MVHEELRDSLPGGLVVLLLARGPDVRYRVVQKAIEEGLANVLLRAAIAGVDQGHSCLRIELGMQIALHQQLGQKDRSGQGIAVKPAREEDHVGPQALEVLDLPVRTAPVVHGQRFQDDRAGAEGHAVRALRRDFPDEAGHDHGQTAARTRGREEGDRRPAVREQRLAGRELERV